MNNKQLGTVALCGAPFQLIGMYAETFIKWQDSWFTGVWGILHITAWMASIVVLQRTGATGKNKFGQVILWVLLGTLTIANVSNFYQMLTPGNKPFFFFYIDICWPLSNIMMLVVGITVVITKQLNGWHRYIPLLTGLWLPFSIILLVTLGKTDLTMVASGTYAAIAWTMLALMVRKLDGLSTTSGRQLPAQPVPADIFHEYI